jgi:hypothetical protein
VDYSNKSKRSFLILSLVSVFSLLISVPVLADTEKKIDDRSISHAIEEEGKVSGLGWDVCMA